MGFWGIEVKPGKPHPYHSDNVRGKLHVTQATLGAGSSTEKTILQCSIGHKNPIYLCSLLPNKNECCPLNLEFEDNDDLVAFSVIGPRSVHLSGYFVSEDGDHIRAEYDTDSYGEDIAETESDESSDYDSEDDYDDDFIDDEDDDFDVFPPSPVPNRGVVIEEIVDEQKPTDGTLLKRLKKKSQSNDSEPKSNSQQLTVVKSGVAIFESEDEDGFPVSASQEPEGTCQEPEVEVDEKADEQTEKLNKKKKGKDDSDHTMGKKRKAKITDQDSQLERKKKKKNKTKQKGEEGEDNGVKTTSGLKEYSQENQFEERSPNLNKVTPTMNEHDDKLHNDMSQGIDVDANGDLSEKKTKKKNKKKKKKKAQESEGATNIDKTVSDTADGTKPSLKSEEDQTANKSSHVRNFPNGLVIKELAMGKPDGKRASPGKQVSVHYIGKLKNGKIFDSNVGSAPFKFRLGLGQVIKGWDVGVNGMRIGDKRRLTIPPSMGYGARGAGGKIPPNSWLLFDVELVDVR